MEPRTQHDDERETARPAETGQARRRRRVLHFCWRTFAWFLEFFAALAAGLAIAAVLIGWRLASGPISLDPLTPWVEHGLSLPERGVAVSIERTELSYDRTTRTVDLLATGVRIMRRDGSAEVLVPRMTLDFSLRAALSLTLAPTRIVLSAPELRLERAPDGTIHLGFGEGSGAENLAGDILADFEATPTHRGPTGYLNEFAIRNAHVTLVDRALGITWQAKDANVTLFRGDLGISGDAQMTVVAGDQQTDVHGDLNYIDAEQRLIGALSFADLVPAKFAAAAPPLEAFKALKLPFSGRVGFSLDVTRLRVEGARGDFTVGSGTIEDPRLSGGSLPINSGVARLAYDPTAARLKIEEVSLDIGGPEIGLTGEVDGLVPQFLRGGALSQLDAKGTLTVKRVPADAMARYWPEWLSRNSRKWVTEHVHDGITEEARADVSLIADFSPGAPKLVEVTSLNGTIEFRNLTIEYFPPLPPVRGVDGRGTFDRAVFDIKPTSGKLAGLKVTAAAIHMSKLDTNDEQIEVNLTNQGPLRDALEIIDTKPLGYAQAVGIDPSKVVGAGEMQLSFAFPLIHDLSLKDVDYSARATLSGVGAAGVVLGHDLSAGELKFELDRNSFKLGGTARIDDNPATISWSETLNPNDRRRHYTLKTRLDDKARDRLGSLFTSDMITGPVDVDIDYSSRREKAEATIALGLTDAAIAIGPLNWNKAPGSAARANFKLLLTDDRLTGVPEATVAGDGIDARFSVALSSESGAVERLDIQHLAAGNTDVAGILVRDPRAGWAATVAGKSLDASGLVSDLAHGHGDTGDVPLSINVKLDRLILGPGREARQFSLHFVTDGQHWQTLVLDAGFPEGGSLSARFNDTSGQRGLSVASDNLGATLAFLDITNNVRGGKVTITGTAADRDGRWVFSGSVDGTDYRLIRAPILARVLSVASFTAVGSMLSGEGLPFDRLRGNYVYDGGKITISNARAYGGALGINADGIVDIREENLDLSGTLVPANMLNSAIGYVPLLGELVGGEGQGVFAANYRVAGPFIDPKVSVNPLSTFAPGLLRRLFPFDAANPTAPPPPPTPEPPSENLR